MKAKLVAAGTDGDRVVVVHNGVDCRPLGRREGAVRDAARAALGAGPAHLLVVTVGRLEHQKAHQHVIAVARALREARPELRYAIIGEGDRAAELAALARKNPDGTIGYGSGVILDDGGGILTNLHVVGNASWIGAMFYERDRVSYTPEDGGLARYIFENQTDIVDVALLRGDPTLDLALVRADADTSNYPHLRFANRPAVLGEPVLALGHPQETVWSFTSGVVSSLHQGVIQTDAAINRGNSGGPLLDGHGKVLGINTSKLLGGTDGIAFARPINLATTFLDRGVGPHTLVLDKPGVAFVACQQAAELGLGSAAECPDWAGFRDALIGAALRALRDQGVSQPQLASIREVMANDPRLTPAALGVQLATALGSSGSSEARLLASSLGGVSVGSRPGPLALAQLESSVGTAAPNWDPALLRAHGMRVDLGNPNGLAELLRLGSRVIDLTPISDGRSWLTVEGRNVDGSVWRYSQLMVRHDVKWSVSMTPTVADRSALGPGSPPQLTTYESVEQALYARALVK